MRLLLVEDHVAIQQFLERAFIAELAAQIIQLKTSGIVVKEHAISSVGLTGSPLLDRCLED